MSIDFFNTQCTESTKRAETEFGLCDDRNGQKAYTNKDDTSKWIATVQNPNQIQVSFTAIDNCLDIKRSDSNDLESTCDGMLTFENSLFLVELKNKDHSGWLKEAKVQLQNTIRILIVNHNLTKFRFKKAYICNKRKPNFTKVHSSENLELFHKTGFRLDIQTNIKIK